MALNVSTIHLNKFASDALSQLTAAFDPELYEDFIDSWGTHIITKSLVGGMTEQQARVPRCFQPGNEQVFARCISSPNSKSDNFACQGFLTAFHMISKRRLGGNTKADDDLDWKRTLAVEPALLQILEMVPWYDFVQDQAVKRNLRAIIGYRQKNAHSIQAEAVRQVDAHLAPCIPGSKIVFDLLDK